MPVAAFRPVEGDINTTGRTAVGTAWSVTAERKPNLAELQVMYSEKASIICSQLWFERLWASRQVSVPGRVCVGVNSLGTHLPHAVFHAEEETAPAADLVS
jgi:hypothetical protein